MFLYHATTEDRLKSIKKYGLLKNKESNWDEMQMNGYIYFSFDPEVAEDYVYESDNYDDQDVVILKVDSSVLDLNKICYDYNNHCETIEDINSIAYDGNIPPKDIQIGSTEDKGYEFTDLRFLSEHDKDIYELVATEYYESCQDWWGYMPDDWGEDIWDIPIEEGLLLKDFFAERRLNEVYPNKGESKKDFITRFMSVTKDEYPDVKQRYAVANSYWERRSKRAYRKN